MFDSIVIRSMIAEAWCARVLGQYAKGIAIIISDDQNCLTESQLERINGKNVLLIGGYYNDCLSAIEAVATSVTVWVQEPIKSDTGRCKVVVGPICATTIAEIVRHSHASVGVADEVFHEAALLDSYLTGKYTDQCMNFQAAIYSLPGSTLYDKVASSCRESTDDLIKRGAVLRAPLKSTANTRAKTSVTLEFNGVHIQCAAGDSPIVESCIALAELSPGGVGILVRQNYATNRTSFTIYSKGEVDAADIAFRFSRGGGSSHSAGEHQIIVYRQFVQTPYNYFFFSLSLFA